MTKILLIVLCSFLSAATTAQIIDDFTDGDFTANPAWNGDVSNFVVSNDSLRSNGPDASASIFLSTPSVAINNATWEFSIKLDFAPSTSNQARVYLVSDNVNLTRALNGYYVSIGQSNEDQINFYKQTGTSSTLLFTGNTLFAAAPVKVSVRVTRDDLGNWEVFADNTGGSNLVSEGTSFFDDTYTSTSYFGVVCKHSSTRKDLFYFDNIVVSTPPDVISPTIVSVTPISTSKIDVVFNESLHQAISETADNYTVNEAIGKPTTAVLDDTDPALVHLTFSTTFINNTGYTLSVQKVEDVYGNAVNSETADFAFLIPESAEVGDILINEIFADPTPSVTLPEAEYIEIYNRSTKYIDLADLTLNEAPITATSHIIAPGEFIVLCDDSNEQLFQEYGNVIGIVAWNTLTNTGETITLRDDDSGIIIDEITYTDNWYNDPQKDDGGYSLERINPNSTCNGASNWTASIHEAGGTAGMQNSVFDNTLDTQAPQLLQAAAINNDSLLLVFDEPLNVSTINKGVYSITPAIAIQHIAETNYENTLIITLEETLLVEQVYTIAIRGLSDCLGNSITTAQTVTFRLPDIPESKDIIINEFMPDPFDQVGLPEAEFVELHNRSDKFFNLGDFELNEKPITDSYVEIAPGNYVILCPEEYVQEYAFLGTTIGLKSWNALTNGGETITLYDSKNNVKVDELRYTSSWYNSSIKNDGGWSLELIDSENMCSSEDNWTASIQPNGGTPGKENSVKAAKPDLVGPILETVVVIAPDTLLLTFNENLDSLSIYTASYNFDNSITIQPSFVSLKQVLLALNNKLSPKILYTFTVNNLKDCTGNITSQNNNTMVFALPEPAVQGDMVLNEVLFNPRTGAPDFVELYNNSNKYIDLQNWMLANKDKSGTPDNLKTIIETPFVVAPNQYVVLTNDSAMLTNEYPAGEIATFLEMKSLPSFPNEEGSVVILLPDSSSYETFDYHEDFHHSLMNSVEGVSLERINVDGITNDAENWHSAASTILATPGYLNSQVKGRIITNSTITVLPKVFIPNQNGIDDFATIHYEFDRPGFVVSIHIVDGRGRVIKPIIAHQTLPVSGDLRWDGTTDNGRKARVGSYMVFVEAFDTNGNVLHFRKRVVVGSGW